MEGNKGALRMKEKEGWAHVPLSLYKGRKKLRKLYLMIYLFSVK